MSIGIGSCDIGKAGEVSMLFAYYTMNVRLLVSAQSIRILVLD